jgi:hypothetical protein
VFPGTFALTEVNAMGFSKFSVLLRQISTYIFATVLGVVVTVCAYGVQPSQASPALNPPVSLLTKTELHNPPVSPYTKG